MRVQAKGWLSVGSAFVGLLVGFGIGSRQQLPLLSSSGKNPSQRNIEYEESFSNAIVFRANLRQQANPDSLFAQTPFLRQAIRMLRQDSAGIEALSLPRSGSRGNYYLIRGDSITQLRLSPHKLR